MNEYGGIHTFSKNKTYKMALAICRQLLFTLYALLFTAVASFDACDDDGQESEKASQADAEQQEPMEFQAPSKAV